MLFKQLIICSDLDVLPIETITKEFTLLSISQESRSHSLFRLSCLGEQVLVAVRAYAESNYAISKSLCENILANNVSSVLPRIVIRNLVREVPAIFPEENRAVIEDNMLLFADKNVHTKNMTETLVILCQLASTKQTEGVAWLLLGLLYKFGVGVPANVSESVRLFRMAAECGNPEAQVMLGLCVERGLGAPQDMHEAFMLYSTAALKGNANAIANLGCCYHSGIGVSPDHKKAAQADYDAAMLGHPRAVQNISQAFFHAFGVTRDVREAVRFLRYSRYLGQNKAAAFT